MNGVGATDVFMSCASPGVISLFFHHHHYGDFEKYILAIADAMRYEYCAVAVAGMILQIDCPDLAMGRHMMYCNLEVTDFRKHIEIHIAALNHALQDIPRDGVRMHLCWGNYKDPHHCDVPLFFHIDIVVKANVSVLSFEAANPRHAHEYTVWHDVQLPDDLVLIPRVIESKSNFIEHPELLAQRICRITDAVGRERVIVGSDCGCGRWVGQAAVEPEIVWAKLAAMAQGAEIASKKRRGSRTAAR